MYRDPDVGSLDVGFLCRGSSTTHGSVSLHGLQEQGVSGPRCTDAYLTYSLIFLIFVDALFALPDWNTKYRNERVYFLDFFVAY